ncbi:MAG: hypothetical protein OXQ27_09990 [Chloroflexota bacterium]|nr:hypothetical protein [Chloroflexota bacterium]
MPPLTIILGIVGVLLLAAGIIGKRAGRRPTVSMGFMGVGVVVLGIAAVYMVSGTSDTASPEAAGATIKVTSTATAVAKTDAELQSAADAADLPLLEAAARPDNFGDLEVFYEATTSVANFDAFRLMGLKAYGPAGHGIGSEKSPFKVGQEIYIEFTVQNLRVPPIELKRTFVAVNHPTGEEKDYGLVHEGVEVVRYQKFETGVVIPLDAAGNWEIWPCYQLVLDDDTLRDRCTPKWQFFTIEVEE